MPEYSLTPECDEDRKTTYEWRKYDWKIDQCIKDTTAPELFGCKEVCSWDPKEEGKKDNDKRCLKADENG